MDKQTKKLIAEEICAIAGKADKKLDWSPGVLYKRAKFFKDNGIDFEKGDCDIVVTQQDRKIAVGHRRWSASSRWSYRRVNLEYKELKPEIEWLV